MDGIETKTNPDETTETMGDTKKAKGEAIEGGRVLTDEAIATTKPSSSSSSKSEDDSKLIIENENEIEIENPLDTKYYYYQNPTTGTVNSTPLSLRQLVKLFCPVREGMKPILPNHTQCLQFKQPPQQQQPEPESSTTNTNTNTSEEWNAASDIDILKEASSSQWYISIPPSLNDGNDADDTTTGSCTTKGPMSCRGLFTEVQQQQQQQQQQQSKSDYYDRIMAYETNISPEWTVISKIQNIQWVFKALNNEDMVQQQQQQQQQKQHNMETHPNHQQDTNVNDDDAQLLASTDEQKQQEIQDELEAFLSSTEVALNTTSSSSSKQQQKQQKLIDDNDEDEHTYESDGGTKYVKDPFSGNWIHEALAPNYDHNHSQTKQKQQQADGNTNTQKQPINNNNKKKKKKKKKEQFSKRNARNWIYVTGLPTTTTTAQGKKSENDEDDEAEVNFDNVAKFFGKVGLLDLDPETLRPKIKLYYNKQTTTGGSSNNNNGLKGDASICYAHPQSVDLALQILDDSLWYDNKTKIKVERAKFEAKGGGAEEENGDGGRGENADNTSRKRQQHKRVHVSEAKRKVARLALKQAQDEGFGGRLAGGRKGLCIIIIKNMIEGIPENKLESEIYNTCEEFGTISKITVIESTKVVIVKFVEPTAASMAIEQLNSKTNPKTSKKLDVMYWDGVTDYTHNPEEEENLKKDEEKRHEEFGKWLEETQRQELPEELRLRVE